MSDANKFVLFAERYDGLLVLEPDGARRLQARYADANKLVEEDAVVRVDSAFRHGFKVTLGLCHHRCGIIIPQAIA